MTRVLVVDDDAEQRLRIKHVLAKQGYEVVEADNGAEALAVLESQEVQIVITDWEMPRLDGLQLCRAIRAAEFSGRIYILFLTSHGEKSKIVEGIDAGADDYLTKPFAIDELLARIRALLRRGSTESPGVLQIDDLALNPATREVTRGGQRIDLTLKEYALLEYLMRHTGRVLTRPMISEHVWNQDFDTFTNVIDVYVNYLRNKIDRGHSKKLIHTIRGSGYMLKVD